MKKNLKILIITSVVILLPILAGIVLWDKLPQRIPTHWNAAGEIDGWSGKPFAVIGIPFMMLAFQWMCVLATSTDPKKHNHSEKILHFIFWLFPVITVLLSTLTYCAALGNEVRINVIVPVLIGLLFVIIGNYLPKCRQNYTIGIKIPWTLNSEENWNRTHRLAGWLWVICGFIIMLSGLFNCFAIFLAVVLIMILVPFVYSYILHRKGI
ncbi:MAG: SdpI family protein [Clostridia bacterium]|nr:SdpI family protein [Clostridia bacterium]